MADCAERTDGDDGKSVDELRADYGPWFVGLEWFCTGVFSLEYGLRIWTVRRKWAYLSSFFGVVDLLSILPLYRELLLPGSHYLMGLRVLRLMRMFRVLKMAEYLGEASVLLQALRMSRRKIMVFLVCVMALVFVEGAVMYVLERDANPDFANIPAAIYWAIVTLTTVGYGDMAPLTVPGKMMASVVMLTGFTIIAVPTGIVTSEIGREMARSAVARGRRRRCRECGWEDHDPRARYCQHCGVALGSEEAEPARR